MLYVRMTSSEVQVSSVEFGVVEKPILSNLLTRQAVMQMNTKEATTCSLFLEK